MSEAARSAEAFGPYYKHTYHKAIITPIQQESPLRRMDTKGDTLEDTGLGIDAIDHRAAGAGSFR